MMSQHEPSRQSNHVIRWYPSALLPPVREPYIFYWDFGQGLEFLGAVANTRGANSRKSPWQDVLKRDRLPMQWHYGPQSPAWKSEQSVVDYYVAVYGKEYRPSWWMSGNSRALKPLANRFPRDIRSTRTIPFGISGSIQGMIEADAPANAHSHSCPPPKPPAYS